MAASKVLQIRQSAPNKNIVEIPFKKYGLVGGPSWLTKSKGERIFKKLHAVDSLFVLTVSYI